MLESFWYGRVVLLKLSFDLGPNNTGIYRGRIFTHLHQQTWPWQACHSSHPPVSFHRPQASVSHTACPVPAQLPAGLQQPNKTPQTLTLINKHTIVEVNRRRDSCQIISPHQDFTSISKNLMSNRQRNKINCVDESHVERHPLLKCTSYIESSQNPLLTPQKFVNTKLEHT